MPRRRALPCAAMNAHSMPSNCGFQVEQNPMNPRLVDQIDEDGGITVACQYQGDDARIRLLERPEQLGDILAGQAQFGDDQRNVRCLQDAEHGRPQKSVAAGRRRLSAAFDEQRAVHDLLGLFLCFGRRGGDFVVAVIATRLDRHDTDRQSR